MTIRKNKTRYVAKNNSCLEVYPIPSLRSGWQSFVHKLTLLPAVAGRSETTGCRSTKGNLKVQSHGAASLSMLSALSIKNMLYVAKSIPAISAIIKNTCSTWLKQFLKSISPPLGGLGRGYLSLLQYLYFIRLAGGIGETGIAEPGVEHFEFFVLQAKLRREVGKIIDRCVY